MTQTLHRFAVHAIDPEVVAQLRMMDDAGNPPRESVEVDGGTPLRCCLRRSRPREAVLLVSFAPVRRWARETGAEPGPYDELGPVFLHAEVCSGPADDGFPDELRDSPRMLRSYSATGTIIGGVPVDAHGDFEGTLDEIFRNEEVAVVHARAVDVGCFTFAVHRR